jgi:DNA invertase Pin-like site-specific DNA recombinase
MTRSAGTEISAMLARREAMLEPDEVSVMLRLNKLGWGTRRIARELGCSRTTVQRYIEAGGWRAFRRGRRSLPQ